MHHRTLGQRNFTNVFYFITFHWTWLIFFFSSPYVRFENVENNLWAMSWEQWAVSRTKHYIGHHCFETWHMWPAEFYYHVPGININSAQPNTKLYNQIINQIKNLKKKKNCVVHEANSKQMYIRIVFPVSNMLWLY